MENEKNENLNSNNETDGGNQEKSEESVESLKAKLADTEEKNRQLFERTKKAEVEAKELKAKLPKESEQKLEKSDNGLLQKTYLRAVGITAEDEVELALETSKKWGTDIDKLVDDPDFKLKLERLRTSKANVKATANVRGGSGSSDVKNTPEFYLSRGTPPTREEVPDKKTRVGILRAFMANSKSGKKFYND